MDSRQNAHSVRVTIDPSLGRSGKCGPPRKGQIALTFDDGPHPVTTPIILDILDQYQVQANFFLVGSEAEKHPDLVRQICGRGHVVGSHSYDHLDLTAMETAAARKNIVSGHNAIRNVSGTKTPFFRFPYLKYSQELEQFVWSLGLLHFRHDIDSQDWYAKSAHDIAKTVCDQYDASRNGVVILHEGLEIVERALPLIIEQLMNKTRFVCFDWVTSSADRFADACPLPMPDEVDPVCNEGVNECV